eukprot:4150194-Amphidinium_carterae.1
MKATKPEVVSALARAWPMEMAMLRFQDTFNSVRQVVQANLADEYHVELIVCTCRESISWLTSFQAAEVSTLVVYQACDTELEPALHAFRKVERRTAPETWIGKRSECSAEAVLGHVLLGGAERATTSVFLRAAEPEGIAHQLLDVLGASLQARTVDFKFIALAAERGQPPNPACARCSRMFWSSLQAEPSASPLPSCRGYEGAYFAVSGAQLASRPMDYFRDVLGAMRLVLSTAECSDEARK